jgi:hypothetical protein
MSTMSATTTLLLTKPNVWSAAEITVLIRSRSLVTEYGIAGNRIDDVLGIRPRDAAILQRIVVVAAPCRWALMKRLPASGRLVTN